MSSAYLHTRLIPVVAEPDDDYALLLGENCLVDRPAGVEMRKEDALLKFPLGAKCKPSFVMLGKLAMLPPPSLAPPRGAGAGGLVRAAAAAAASSSTSAVEECEDLIAAAVSYHQATKHSFTRYARGPHGLDWANQPNPFRRYKGAPLVSLDHVGSSSESDPPYCDVFRGAAAVRPKPVSKQTLSQLLYDCLALSAWKTTGYSTWSLRVNPSSGNLHPTEGYVVSAAVDGISSSPFVAHYAPKVHGLEMRTQVPVEVWRELTDGLPQGSLFVGLSSIFWREAWKYGERAFRYCNHDVGHAIGAVGIAAATLGWKCLLLDGWGTRELHLLLGLGDDRVKATSERGVKRGHFPELEKEHGDCLMVLFPQDSSRAVAVDFSPSPRLVEKLAQLQWNGKANALSREHVRWDIIYKVAEATRKPNSVLAPGPGPTGDAPQVGAEDDDSVYKQVSVRQLVRTRRSAVSMDGRYAMEKQVFYQILVRSMPSLDNPGSPERLPFSALPWNAEVSMVLFVHRVVGIEQGVYFLLRNPLHEDALKTSMKADFKWEKPPGCPAKLPLYLLVAGDCRTLAEQLSCHQDIASDGCFSLGMVARFESSIHENGAWMYPRLFWEAGLLGQVLYLEAHAVGVSATGIGCYFDDPVHQVLGLKDKQFQSLYHFTVGVPTLDKRIMNLPAYPGPESAISDDVF